MRGRDLAVWLALAATWGASYLFIRIAAPAMGAFPLAAVRVAIAAVVLWAVMLARRERVDLRANAGTLLLLGLVHAAAPYALVAAAERQVDASTTSVVLAVQPLWTALLGAMFLRERASWRTFAALALGVAGVGAIVGWRPGGLATIGVPALLAMLAAAGLYAAGSVLARARCARVPGLTLAFGQQLAALAWLVLPAARQWPHAWPAPHVLAGVLVLGVMCTAFAYVLFFGLVQRVGALRASTVTYGIPVFGIAWGALFLGERPAPGLFAGLALTAASLALVHGGFARFDPRAWRVRLPWPGARPVA